MATALTGYFFAVGYRRADFPYFRHSAAGA
jgi:hypothetical protein